jgi:hypothetical protein
MRSGYDVAMTCVMKLFWRFMEVMEENRRPRIWKPRQVASVKRRNGCERCGLRYNASETKHEACGRSEAFVAMDLTPNFQCGDACRSQCKRV